MQNRLGSLIISNNLAIKTIEEKQTFHLKLFSAIFNKFNTSCFIAFNNNFLGNGKRQFPKILNKALKYMCSIFYCLFLLFFEHPSIQKCVLLLIKKQHTTISPNILTLVTPFQKTTENIVMYLFHYCCFCHLPHHCRY